MHQDHTHAGRLRLVGDELPQLEKRPTHPLLSVGVANPCSGVDARL
jgi:hypothetical protein